MYKVGILLILLTALLLLYSDTETFGVTLSIYLPFFMVLNHRFDIFLKAQNKLKYYFF